MHIAIIRMMINSDDGVAPEEVCHVEAVSVMEANMNEMVFHQAWASQVIFHFQKKKAKLPHSETNAK